MTVYYINPKINISNKFENIMINLINEISNLFVNDRNLIILENYQNTILDILAIVVKYLKIYKFYDYGIKNLYIQIYNKAIEVLIYVKINISKSYFKYINNSWYEFYFRTSINLPIVYDEMNNDQQNDLNTSIINGNLYFNNNIILSQTELTKGMILKKETCECNINNCNTTLNYIITIFW